MEEKVGFNYGFYLYNLYSDLNPSATKGTEVNFKIYILIELLIRASFQNTEAGISIPVSHEMIKA